MGRPPALQTGRRFSMAFAPGLRLGEFSERLRALRTTDEFRDLVLEVVQPMGFSHFAYHIIQTPDVDNVRTRQAYGIFSYPDQWTRHYIAYGYVNDDPVIAKVYEEKAPFIWSDKISVDELSKKQRKLLDDASAMGLTEGLTIPLQSRAGETASMSLIPGKMTAEELHSPGLINMVHLMAEYVHGHAARVVIEEALTNSSKRRRSLLSPREAEALTWVARGKSTWEVARILDLSEKSVEFYLDSCKHKLQATNRTQAVVKAIVLGLITFRE
jgi:DNA-binding CsgD family transcriptional regulator